MASLIAPLASHRVDERGLGQGTFRARSSATAVRTNARVLSLLVALLLGYAAVAQQHTIAMSLVEASGALVSLPALFWLLGRPAEEYQRWFSHVLFFFATLAPSGYMAAHFLCVNEVVCDAEEAERDVSPSLILLLGVTPFYLSVCLKVPWLPNLGASALRFALYVALVGPYEDEADAGRNAGTLFVISVVGGGLVSGFEDEVADQHYRLFLSSVNNADRADEAERQREGAEATKSAFVQHTCRAIRSDLHTALLAAENITPLLEELMTAARQRMAPGMADAGPNMPLRAERDSLDAMLQSCVSIGRVLDDINCMDAFHSGHFRLNKAPFAVRACLDTLLSPVRSRAAELQVTFTENIRPTVPPLFFGDWPRIAQILRVLLDHALDFTPTGGRVLLSVEMTQQHGVQHVHYLVSDTGVSQMRDVLEQLAGPTSGGGKPSRIGLSVAKRVAEAHGGQLVYDKRKKRGCHLLLRLPFEEPTVMAARAQVSPLRTQYPSPEALAAVRAAMQGRSVLVVEDCLRTWHMTRILLQRLGFTSFAHARNGAEAIVLVERHDGEFDFLLVDDDMPVMGGVACVRALRRMQYGGSVIGLSGNSDESSVAAFRAAGAFEVLPKPVHLAHLGEVLTSALRATFAEAQREPRGGGGGGQALEEDAYSNPNVISTVVPARPPMLHPENEFAPPPPEKQQQQQQQPPSAAAEAQGGDVVWANELPAESWVRTQNVTSRHRPPSPNAAMQAAREQVGQYSHNHSPAQTPPYTPEEDEDLRPATRISQQQTELRSAVMPVHPTSRSNSRTSSRTASNAGPPPGGQSMASMSHVRMAM